MYQTEIFLCGTIFVILILLFCQSLSFRICVSEKTTVSIEYFPFILFLYNFTKRKRRKRSILKRTKRLIFLFTPLMRALRFLLTHSKTKIFSISFPTSKSDEPHNYFISNKLSDISELYVSSLIYALTKSTIIFPSAYEKTDKKTLDLELTTKFYNLTFAFFAFIFFCIKKKGRN